MIVLVIGPSGSGKGTQAELLAKKLGVPALSMGQLMRDEMQSNTDLGKKLSGYLSQGLFTPTELTLETLTPELEKHPGGFVLDGFPRRLENLTKLEEYLHNKNRKIDKIIYLKIADEEAVKRLTKRAEVDKQTTGLARHDDTDEVIRQRLQSFHETIDPILPYAREKGYLEEVDGERSVEEIHQQIMARLNG